PPYAAELVGGYLEMVRRLGERVAEFHRVLASEPILPAFAPEPFDPMYARSIVQTMQTEREQLFGRLRLSLDRLPEAVRPLATELLGREGDVERRFRRLLERRYSGQRIRIHGDLHLGQVLWTGKDFVIIDLEGEPLRPITERRLKRSALRDVAGMLRSFDYAAGAAIREIPLAGGTSQFPPEALQPLADLWVGWCSAEFLRGYHGLTEASPFLPQDPGERRSLLGAYLLEKAIYEIGYEISNRPAWLPVPIRGLLRLLSTEG
ncbi:MAG: phosphotransferase, partial [Thermoplasmata archaeon]